MEPVVDDQGTATEIHVAKESLRGSLSIEVRGARNRIEIGDALHIRDVCRIRVDGDDNVVEIGSQLDLKRGSIVCIGRENRVVIGSRCSGRFDARIEADQSSIRLGTHCTAIRARIHIDEPAHIELGDDCMLSADVWLLASDSHPIYEIVSGRRVNPAADVRIGDHVWLGFRSMVLKGAVVGSGAVIGAGAVVTGAVPRDAVAAGNPARIVREGIRWAREPDSFSAQAAGTITEV